MTRWLSLILLLLACAGTHAMPAASPEDDLQQFIADQALLTTLEKMSQKVTINATDLVANAMGFLGVPYRRGGNSAESGFDCSGFVQAMYQNTIGLVLPRRAKEQAAATEKIDKQDLQPGDLVFFNTMRRAFSHVGIYIGEGKFIHSPKPGAQVRVENLSQGYWQRRFNGAHRVLGLEPAEPAGPQP
jgi:cell wall-associated NlpC family hydrolase